MENHKEAVLFITDKIFVDYKIPGGVQVCTAEFIEYLKQAGLSVNIYKVEPSISFFKKIKIKLGVEVYEMYNIDHYINDIVETINNEKIKLVLFNQLNLAFYADKIKPKVHKDVRFVGLSHGNESGDYLHDITNSAKTSFLNTWKLGKLIIKEKTLFTKLLHGVVTISDNETFINQWIGAQKVFYLPRLLRPALINHSPLPETIGFVGTLNHLPNLSAITLLSEQLQLKKFSGVLRLVGSPEHTGKELEKKYPFIQYCGALDNDQLVEEIKTWSIFINPIFWYARGSSTKLAIALNWGIPVITTPAGARGYDLNNRDIVTSNNDPKSFADMIFNALASNILLENLRKSSIDNSAHFKPGIWADKFHRFLTSL